MTEPPIDPELGTTLEVIDATLAGEPVDPEYADLAELTLLLAAERPALERDAAQRLDERVRRRFARRPRAVKRWRWYWVPGVAASLLAVVAVIGVLSALPEGGSPRTSTTASTPSVQGARHGSAAAGSAVRAPQTSSSSAASVPALRPSPSAGATGAPTPPGNGRKITQSSQLALSTAPGRVDDVAQEVFNVVGAQNGIVNNSTVTATGGPDGYAEFTLSIPSANLAQAMSALSRLRYASVASRTDSTQDVNGQFLGLTRQLADAQALRTSLLKQLANASTQAQIDSLNGRIHDVDGKIGGLQAQLRGLNHQIDYSSVTVTINAALVPVAHGDGGFTIGRAVRDSVRVLTVAGGVALIGLAALVPVGLVTALAWWIAAALRRRRREQALELA